MRLLLATNNRKKLDEFVRLLEEFGERRELGQQLGSRDQARELGSHAAHELRIVIPSDLGGLPEVLEDQSTFAGNAAKKACSAARATGLWALADDSGLEVDALGGEPGVHSARFAGRHGDDEANNRLLLERLRGVPDERRAARFVCALALARPDGSITLALEGEARGRILHEQRGTHDFGYDPLFLFTEPGFAQSGRGFAELDAGEKGEVSHRGRALRALIARLDQALHEI